MVGVDHAVFAVQTPFLFVVPLGQAVTQASAVLIPLGQFTKQIWLW